MKYNANKSHVISALQKSPTFPTVLGEGWGGASAFTSSQGPVGMWPRIASEPWVGNEGTPLALACECSDAARATTGGIYLMFVIYSYDKRKCYIRGLSDLFIFPSISLFFLNVNIHL